ncbi:MAG: SRPBCC family protein [Mycobacteriaceae bacterium]
MDSVSVYIGVGIEQVWEEITDIDGMGSLSPENTGGYWISGSAEAIGSVFKGSNKHGLIRWSTTCTVVGSESPRYFSFEVAESQTRWTYFLESQEKGTLVTETREKLGDTAWHVRLINRLGLIGRNRDELMVSGMHATLAALKSKLEPSR